MTTTTTRFEELAQKVQLEMSEEYRKAALITDATKMITAINEIQSRMNQRTQEMLDAEVASKVENDKKSQQLVEGFQILASEALTKVWTSVLAPKAQALTNAPMFIFRVERAEDGTLGTPTFIVGKVTKVPATNGSSVAKNYKVKFHGKVYDSVAHAFKELMPNTPAPSKSATGRAAYSKLECLPILEEAGHVLEK